MSAETAIEWCDSTFNPWIGCTRISPACDDCYAARSTPARTLVVAWGPGEQRHRTADSTWEQPRKWQRQAAAFQAQHGRRRRVFCASLADWLDNEAPAGWLVDLLQLIRDTPDLDWLLLTKRIGNWHRVMNHAAGMAALAAGRERWPGLAEWICDWLDGKPPHNVWMGSTVINQTEVDRDVPKLLATPAAVRFLSIEPMLGPIDLTSIRQPLRGDSSGESYTEGNVLERKDTLQRGAARPSIDWLICGGESGPKARPMHPDWARSLRDQCAAAGAPFLFKQWGEWAPDDRFTRLPTSENDIHEWGEGQTITGHSWRYGKKAAGRQLDGRTHDAWPKVLRLPTTVIVGSS